MILLLFLLTLVSFAIGWPMTWLVRRGGLARGHLDGAGTGGHQKQEIRQIPNIGGMAIFAGIVGPMVVGLIALRFFGDSFAGRFLALEEHLPGVAERLPMALSLIGCLLLLHVMGLADDRQPLGPGLKLAVQFGVSFVMVWVGGFESRLLTLLDEMPGLAGLAPWPSVFVTMLWLVVMTNALNMLDNMDGLAGGVAAIASLLFLVAAIINGQWFVAAVLALMFGSLIAFLCFNFPPASIFMGDGGSLVVGFLLGFLTVRTTYVPEGGEVGWYAVFMPVVVLAIPLYDLVSVVLIRVSQGRNPMVGDQQHFSHRLVERGLSRTRAVLVIYGFTLATGLAGIVLTRVTGWVAALVGAQVVVLLLVLGLYEHGTRQNGNRAKNTAEGAES